MGRTPPRTALVAASLGILLAAACAAKPCSAQAAPATAPGAAPGWEVSIAPYVWLAGLSGDLGGPGPLPDLHAGGSIGDTLDALRFGAMVMGVARYDRFVAIGDLAYVELATSKNLGVRDPGLVSKSLELKQFMSTAAGGYRAVDGPVSVDLVAGLRVVSIKEDVRLSGPGRSESSGLSKTLADPIVAARVAGPFNDRWGYELYGDVGGFGVASKLTWQAMGLVKYRAGPRWTAAAGWRHLAIDTAKNGFRFDAAMDGPILGAAYHF